MSMYVVKDDKQVHFTVELPSLSRNEKIKSVWLHTLQNQGDGIDTDEE